MSQSTLPTDLDEAALREFSYLPATRANSPIFLVCAYLSHKRGDKDLTRRFLRLLVEAGGLPRECGQACDFMGAILR